MFDRIQPFELKYIQKASPKEGDAFDFSLIYKFYTDKTEELLVKRAVLFQPLQK